MITDWDRAYHTIDAIRIVGYILVGIYHEHGYSSEGYIIMARVYRRLQQQCGISPQWTKQE